MNLGRRLQVAKRDWKKNAPPILGLFMTISMALGFFIAFFLVVNVSGFSYKGDASILLYLSFFMVLLSLYAFYNFNKLCPSHSFIIYEYGVRVSHKRMNKTIHYRDIHEFLHFYQKSGLLTGLMFREKEGPWILYTPLNGEKGLMALREAYFNYAYPKAKEEFEKGRTLYFHYIKEANLAKYSWTEKEMLEVAELFHDAYTLTLNRDTISINETIIPFNEIISLSTGYGNQKLSLTFENNEAFTVDYGSLCHQDIFTKLFEEKIYGHQLPPLSEIKDIKITNDLNGF